ncbi:MAG: porin [Acidobacteriota bacterium]
MLHRTLGRRATTATLALAAMLFTGAAVNAEEVKWDKKKVKYTAANGKLTMEFNNRVQFRYTLDDPEDGDDKGSFRVRRAKFKIAGKVFENWKYKIQAVWSGGSTTLEDAYFQYTKNKMAQLWLGQGKAWFGRQELTSSGKQQFVDRSITSGRFSHGRDQGLALIGKNDSKTFEYNLGIYNGNGRNRSSNDNDEYLYVGRVVFTPFGEYKPEESSLDYPESSKLAIGASILENSEGSNADEDVSRFGVEFAYKYLGLNMVGEYFTEELDLPGASDSVDTDGFYYQIGYLFPNKKFEIAGRYAVISPDVPFDADEIETGVALSYYMSKHNYKIQGDYRQIEDELADVTDDQFRVQIQFAF